LAILFRRLAASLVLVSCSLLLLAPETAGAVATQDTPSCCDQNMCPAHGGHHSPPGGPQVSSGQSCCSHECCPGNGVETAPLLASPHQYLPAMAQHSVATLPAAAGIQGCAGSVHLRGPPSLR
jgi:hypothetical protein